MSDLPSTWATARLGDLGMVTTENINPAQMPETEFELWSVPAFPSNRPEYILGARIGSNKQRVEPEDVLLCKINPRINRVWKVGQKRDKEQIASTEWIVFRCPQMDADFLAYRFRDAKFREELCAGVSGVGGSLTRARPQLVANLSVSIPPLNEQRRIAARLEELFVRVDACRKRLGQVPRLLKQFRRSVIAAACSGKLTADWRGDGSNTDLPSSWRWVHLEDVLIKGGIFDGPFGSNLKTEDYTGEGVRVIRLENIGHLSFIHEKKTYISQKKYGTLIRHKVGEGDIIFASFIDDEIRACVLPELETDAIAKADCFCLRPDARLVDRTYLTYQLVCRDTYRTLTENIHGATRPRINTTQLRRLKVRVCPPEEQEEIVRRVEALFKIADAVEDHYIKAQEQLEKLPQAILAKAFRGGLVPQDPNDEPASVLLERVRAERAGTAKPGKKVKRAGAARSKTAAGPSTLF